MSLVEINWKPDRKTLAEFSEFGLFFIGMVAAPLAYFKGNSTLAGGLWMIAVALRLCGWIRPELVRYPYLALTVAAWPIGLVVSNVLIAALYFLVLTPIGLLRRLRGVDTFGQSFDRDATTYWEPYNPDRGPERYLRQF
ncbi:MAG: hypothetical protein KGM43_08120 [Planctomycetota bacterium]|nr:hypothetical protein [Planctomycetota bacterium]